VLLAGDPIRKYCEKEVMLKMKVIWLIAAVAAIYGAIAGSFFEGIPLTAISFALLAIVFVLAAYREISKGG